ncbi:hypothetical protein JHK87_017408 [Glycine soja]|nr:hypothetical protein JHK87_017408 [Glycine soja]
MDFSEALAEMVKCVYILWLISVLDKGAETKKGPEYSQSNAIFLFGGAPYPVHYEEPEVQFGGPTQRRLESDFLGVSKSENQSDLAAINEIRSNDSDYLFTNNSLVPMQNQVVDTLAMSIKKMLIAIYNH